MVVPIAASGAGETNAQRLDDIGAAIAVIDNHVGRGALSDGLIFEAVRARLIETGEALEAISPALLEAEPHIPWADIAGMRDHLAHAATSTPPTRTIEHDLPPLRVAVERPRSVT